MAVQVTPHPSWVAELDSTLEPSRQAILDTPVIIDASENQLVDGQIQNFLVSFYPIIRDFPQWLQVLLDRSPATSSLGRESHLLWDMFHPVSSEMNVAEAKRSRINAFGISYEGKTGLSTSEFSWAA